MTDSWVYFVRLGNVIKIGYTTNLERRMQVIPGQILATVPGNLADEAAFHGRFADLQEWGEWFRAEPPLTDYVATLPSAPNPRVRMRSSRQRTYHPDEDEAAVLARVGRIADDYEDAARSVAALRVDRDALVLELHGEGLGYDRIAAALCMTKARVQQVVRATRRAHAPTGAFPGLLD